MVAHHGYLESWDYSIAAFVLAGALITIDCLGGKLPSDIVVMVVTLAFFGFACGEFGKRLPIVGKLGAAAICATFIPSAMVYYGLLPDVVVESTTGVINSGAKSSLVKIEPKYAFALPKRMYRRTVERM